MSRVIVIGAGAAGCFCSIELKRLHPDADVLVLESGSKPLRKVARTGGGRCNLTNTFENAVDLKEIYPRGHRLMKRALCVFSQIDTAQWFRNAGVRLKVEDGGRVFPVSDDALQIVRCLEHEMQRSGVRLQTDTRVTDIIRENDGTFTLGSTKGTFHADKVAICSGGGALQMLSHLPIQTTALLPSLFGLRLQGEGLGSLEGVSCADCTLTLAGKGIQAYGDVLITPWGVTGPGVLKLSSYAAPVLAESAYQGTLLINWGSRAEDEIRSFAQKAARGSAMVRNLRPEGIAERLWLHIMMRARIREDMRWAELGSKGISRLCACVCADQYPIIGRAPHKEEFVTCGGVALSDIVLGTLESRSCPGMHFAGEALDVDAITGGYNLQAAWSTAIMVARSLL